MTASLIAPILLVPTPPATGSLTTDISTLTLILQTPTNALFIQATILGSQPSVQQSTNVLFENNYMTDAFNKYFSLPITLGPGVNSIAIQYFTTYPSASATDLAAAASPVLTVPFVLDTSSSRPLTPLAPTGFTISQRALDVRVAWTTPTEDSYIGSNFYMSATSGGPYFKVNTSPITAQDPTATTPMTYIVIPLSAIPTAYQGTTYSSAYTFYGVATTMALTSTGLLMESPNSIEMDLRFYNFPSEYTSPINRNEADIQNALITSVNSYEGTLDVKPGSVLQDIFVNPVSTELARAYQRLHFYHFAGSLPTLIKYEDENGDGVPDTLAQSPLRQELYQAFNLSSSAEVQTWIDMAFERLASSQFDGRRGATTASGVVTFFTLVQPNQDINIPTGTVVSSSTTTLNGLNPPNFITVETGNIPIQGLASYYNAALARWEVTVHVVSTTTGAAGNVGAGTLNTVSGISGLQVTNTANLFGGLDLESNLDLAARLRDCYLAKDPGRKAGITSWITQSAGIYSCQVVGAGDPYMMRDYDELRQRHVYGRADAYVDSRAISEQTQTLVMTPALRSTGSMTVVPATVTLVSATTSDWVFTVSNPAIQVGIPPFAIDFSNANLSPAQADYPIVSWSYTNLQAGVVTIHIAPIKGYPLPLATDKITANITLPIMQAGTTGTTAKVISTSATDWAILITDPILAPADPVTNISPTPVYQVTYVRNQTQGIFYVLTNWSTSDANNGSVTLHLDPTQNANVSANPTPALTDILDLQIAVFYSPGYLLNVQPVLSINAITGEPTASGGAGSIDLSTVNLFEAQDPMGIGNSVRDTAYMVITPSMQSHTEPITFVTPDPLNPTAAIDMTYTAEIMGAVPFSAYTPTIVNNFDLSSTLVEGVHYTLSINSNQQLVVTRLPNQMDPSSGSYILTYQTYTVFPRKFKVIGEPVVLNGTSPTYLMNIGVDVNASSFQVTSDLAGTQPLLRYNPGVVSVPNYRLTPYDNNVQVSGTSSPYDQDYWAAQSATLAGVYSASQSSIESPVGIINMNLSLVPDGSTVYVSYEYYENLTVLYSVDQGVIDAQTLVEANRSCTADILVKHCSTIPVTAQMSVTLMSGADQTTVDTNIRTAVFGLFDSLNVGEGIVEADIVKAVMNTSGVANMVLPLGQLSYADGAIVIQENLPLWTATTELNTGSLSSSTPIYKSQTRSLYPSRANGGFDYEYVAAYEDGLAMQRCHSVTEFLQTGVGDYGTFYVAPNPIDYRLDIYINPNRLSSETADINSHAHSLTYHVYGDSSTHDLAGGTLSILSLNSLLINYSV